MPLILSAYGKLLRRQYLGLALDMTPHVEDFIALLVFTRMNDLIAAWIKEARLATCSLLTGCK
jgi:hypothetical protein